MIGLSPGGVTSTLPSIRHRIWRSGVDLPQRSVPRIPAATVRTVTRTSRLPRNRAKKSEVKRKAPSATFIAASKTLSPRMRMRGDNVFEAAMKVAEGAFRFTSDFFARFRGRREVRVTVRTVAAGIRGTDLWGKSTPDRQILCLIEGKIDVTPPGESPIGMDQRLSFYVREGGQSQPVAIVLADQLREWAGETETQAGRGVSKRGGKWKLTASPGLAPNRALDLYRDLRNAGYPAEIIPAKVGNKRVYNVRLSNFETRRDAEFVASALKQHPGLRQHEYKVGT